MAEMIATPEQRRELGRARRRMLHRRNIAEWSAKQRSNDAITTLRASEKGRVPSLLQIKHARMAASPFGYFRGAVAVMAADLAIMPDSGIHVQICGDAHTRNLGAFASPDGRLLFDINDFDETMRAPFEFDVRRMAVSLVLAGRTANQRKANCSDAVASFLERYARTMRQLADMRVLDAARWQVHRLQRIQPVSEALLKAERMTPLKLLEQLTEKRGHARQFRTEPPLFVRLTGSKAQQILSAVPRYRETLLPERRHFLDQYRTVDVAMKVVGTGSVGLRCFVIYLEGNGPDDPLFLQLKEERHSAWARYLPALAAQSPAHQGQRVAEGQRAMQLESDAMIGWTSFGGRDYYVRQLNDHKGSVPDDTAAGDGLQEYAQVCGELLARGHCRSGDACMLTGYLGNGGRVAEAVASFALRYADQVEQDWEQMCEHFKLKPGTPAA